MGNLLLLFARVGNLILFIILEILCFYLIVNYNQTQKSIFLNSSGIFSAFLNKKMNATTDYFKLDNINDGLAEENSKLLESLVNLRTQKQLPPEKIDSIQHYKLIPATVINNSVMLKNNRITLDKGKKDGLEIGQGIITENGLVGIINNVSNNYATAISLLNLQTSISVRHKRTGEIGELKWEGRSIYNMTMSSVPPHADIILGDSIITSGFSTIFPPDIFVGEVSKVETDRRNGFQLLEVKLNNDLSSLQYVYVIKNLKAEEQLELEANE
jgi:rod shape-determining protein MreC